MDKATPYDRALLTHTIDTNRRDAARILMNAAEHETAHQARLNAIIRLREVKTSPAIATFLARIYKSTDGELREEARESFLAHHRQLSD